MSSGLFLGAINHIQSLLVSSVFMNLNPHCIINDILKAHNEDNNQKEKLFIIFQKNNSRTRFLKDYLKYKF